MVEGNQPQTAVTEDMLIGEFQIMGAGYEDGRMPALQKEWDVNGVVFKFHYVADYQVTLLNPEKFDHSNPYHIQAMGIGLEIYRQLYNVAVVGWVYEEGDFNPDTIGGIAKLPDEIKRLKRMQWEPCYGYIPGDYARLIKSAQRTCEALWGQAEIKRQTQEWWEAFRNNPKHGYIYLLQSVTGAYKIGRSKDPDDRLKTFEVKLPFEVSYVCTVETADMYMLEKKLHQLFEHKRINGEWFSLNDKDIAAIKALADIKRPAGVQLW